MKQNKSQRNISLPSPTGRGKAAAGGAGEGLPFLIKVCGMRQPDNIRAVAQLPIDMIGFIFYPRSSRYVGMEHVCAGSLPDVASRSVAEAGSVGAGNRRVQKVGVFVDATVQDIIAHVVAFGLDAVQLHGTESPTFVRNMLATIVPDIRPQLKVLKAISIADAADFDLCAQYEGLVDMFVFDTKCPGHGGSGRQYDWSLMDSYHGHTPFLLSGGIGEDDAGRILSIRHPQFAGVDLNSRFETQPALKDVGRIARFVERIRSNEPKNIHTI